MVVPKLKISESEDQKPLNLSPKKSVIVSIPKSDDESFNSFFVSETKKCDENIELSDDIFDGFSDGVSDL